MEHVELVLKRISVAGLKLKMKKWRFVQTKEHVVGHVVFDQAIAANHEKTSIIAKALIPSNNILP